MKQSSGGSCALLICDVNTLCVQKDDVFTLKASPKWGAAKNKVVSFWSYLEPALFGGGKKWHYGLPSCRKLEQIWGLGTLSEGSTTATPSPTAGPTHVLLVESRCSTNGSAIKRCRAVRSPSAPRNAFFHIGLKGAESLSAEGKSLCSLHGWQIPLKLLYQWNLK